MQSLNVSDILYGSFAITEQVIPEIIYSPEIQRLKHISSGGYYPAWPVLKREQFNRYYHSLGVFLLLRRFNASLEEQIAGLIHDVSHSAFSHTIDYIKSESNSEKNHDFQDRIHSSYVKNSSISHILEKYGFNVDYILDDTHFSLKENTLPDICADRIDYCLRQAFDLNFITNSEKQFILDSLCIHKGSFVFNNAKAAIFFADLFYKMDNLQWSGLPSAVMFSLSSKLFKRALALKILVFDDFYRLTDNEIIQKIESNLQDDELKYFYTLLQKDISCFKNNPNNYIDRVFCKVRRINPFFVSNDKLYRAAEKDEPLAKKLADNLKYREYFIEAAA